MTNGTTTPLGTHGESIAAEWLTEHGYEVLERNWRCARGEIDVIAWDGDTLVFIEVKTRAGCSTGHPFEAITDAKVARLRRLVPAWFAEHPDVGARSIRIDAVAVHIDGPRNVVEHVAGIQ